MYLLNLRQLGALCSIYHEALPQQLLQRVGQAVWNGAWSLALQQCPVYAALPLKWGPASQALQQDCCK